MLPRVAQERQDAGARTITHRTEIRTMTQDQIKSTVKDYILREFLPGEDPEELTESTPLISGGILDSLVTLKLVVFLEETYGMKFEANEVTVDNLDTITDIANFVSSKIAVV